MNITSTNIIPELIFNHGYVFTYSVIFILMFLEGPIVTYICAFASSLGYLSIWIVIALSILGNQIPDMIIYLVGRILRKGTVERFVEYFGLNKRRIKSLEKNIKKHIIKTILIIKFVPPISFPGIILSGFLKVSFKKFFWINLISNVGLAIIFSFLGYYSGIAVDSMLKYLKMSQYLILILVVLVIVLYCLVKIAYRKISPIINSLDKKI